MGTGSVRIGISGWRYAPWRGVFYPPALAQRCELHYASRIFNSIEINGSFYSLQRPEVYARWYADTPAGFQFAVKGPRFITHMKRLRDSARPLGNFFASGVCELREKLGPILWQLPPTLRFHPEVIEEFLSLLPRNTQAASRLARTPGVRLRGNGRWGLATGKRRRLRHALEVRHESFRDPQFIAMLRRHGVALVVSDSPKTWLRLEDVTADFLYLRLHGATRLYKSGYSPAALVRWGRRIRTWQAGGVPAGSQLASGRAPPHRSSRDVYCYFDNTDAKVRAPANARQLAQRFGQPRRC
jgi:uncharacterized protein YecE (DUF72 family)